MPLISTKRIKVPSIALQAVIGSFALFPPSRRQFSSRSTRLLVAQTRKYTDRNRMPSGNGRRGREDSHRHELLTVRNNIRFGIGVNILFGVCFYSPINAQSFRLAANLISPPPRRKKPGKYESGIATLSTGESEERGTDTDGEWTRNFLATKTGCCRLSSARRKTGSEEGGEERRALS